MGIKLGLMEVKETISGISEEASSSSEESEDGGDSPTPGGVKSRDEELVHLSQSKIKTASSGNYI